MRFPIFIHKDEGSCFGVTVPDLPGCTSAGDTLDDAFSSVQEAILGHIDTMLMEGEPLPNVNSLQAHLANDDYQDGIFGFVDVDLAAIPDRKVHVNISLPSRMLDTIDTWAKREGESRSGFLIKAVLEHISAKSLEEEPR